MQLALELSEKNRSFQESDLSPEASVEVQRASVKGGLCSRCRYQSGCLSCERGKAFRYYKKKEERD